MVAGRRRGGKPRTEAERARRHGGTPPPRGTGQFCKILNDGLKDEAKADKYYSKLNLSLREHVREEYGGGEDLRRDLDIIDGIRGDEQAHKIALTALYNRRCT